MKHHPGEISFPGGRVEKNDRDLIKTALRETWEEVGLELMTTDVIARLPTVMTRTGFEVAPYVSMLNRNPQAKPSSEEVEEVLEIPLIPLLATGQRDPRVPKAGEDMFVYLYMHHKIWGASAKILQQIEKLNLV